MVSSQDFAQFERRRHRNRVNAARARQRNKENLQRLEMENRILKRNAEVLNAAIGNLQVDRTYDALEWK